MIRITKDIKIKDKKLHAKARHIKRYIETTVWFLFIPLFTWQRLLRNPDRDMAFVNENIGSDYPTFNDKKGRVYVPSKDENRKLEGKEEASFEN